MTIEPQPCSSSADNGDTADGTTPGLCSLFLGDSSRLGIATYSPHTCTVMVYEVHALLSADGSRGKTGHSIPIDSVAEVPPSLLWLRTYLETNRPFMLLPDDTANLVTDLVTLLRLEHALFPAKSAFNAKEAIPRLQKMYPEKPPSFFEQKYNVNSVSMLSAMAALLQYLVAANTAVFDVVERPPPSLLYMEDATADWLQVRRRESHPCEHQGIGRPKEALSLLSTVNHAVSEFGRAMMHQWFTLPHCALDDIICRQEMVTFFVKDRNQELLHRLREMLRSVRPTGRVFTCMRQGKATRQHYRSLLCTIKAMLSIESLLRPIAHEVSTLRCVVDSIPRAELERFDRTIQNNFAGFNKPIEPSLDALAAAGAAEPGGGRTGTSSRMPVFWGVNDTLDQLRNTFCGLSDELNMYSHETVRCLPPHLHHLSVQCVYQTYEGYLVTIPELQLHALCPQHVAEPLLLSEGVDMMARQFEDELRWRLIISRDGMCYFKTPMMAGLDREAGDVLSRIRDQELRVRTSIERRLLRCSTCFLQPAYHLAELDCLLSFAHCALMYNWCCPTFMLTNGEVHITEGWHPVLQQAQGSREPVRFSFDVNGPEERLCVVTGDGGGGKSVLLGAIVHIQLLAQLGSYVPARAARLGLVGCVLSCSAVPGGRHGCSSNFTSECLSLAAALRHCRARAVSVGDDGRSSFSSPPLTIILMDDFGRGTAPADALSLQTGVMEYFASREPWSRPLLLATMHYGSLYDQYRFSRNFPFEAVMVYDMPREKVMQLQHEVLEEGAESTVTMVPTYHLKLVTRRQLTRDHRGDYGRYHQQRTKSTKILGAEQFLDEGFLRMWEANQAIVGGE